MTTPSTVWPIGSDASKPEIHDYMDGLSGGARIFVIKGVVATPPSNPSADDKYLVAVGGAGAFSGQDGKIADWDGSQWIFHDDPDAVIQSSSGALAILREVITEDRDYFVDPSEGSDSNDGLSSGAAFSTLSKAISTAQALDASIYQVTINLADATYTEQLTVSAAMIGSQALVISGNSSNPQNVILNGTFAAKITNGTGVKLQHLEIRGVVHGLNVTSGAIVTLGAGIIFGPCGNFQIFAQGGEVVATAAAYEIAGSCAMHIYAAEGGIVRAEGATITISVPITLAIFIIAATGALAAVNGITFINPANVTGQKYSAASNAIINTAGGGASYFPGTVAGGTDGYGVFQ